MQPIRKKKPSATGRLGSLTRPASLSFVMVGLDPTIHAPGGAVDPRVKPEDDVEDMAKSEKPQISACEVTMRETRP
jgi:hypothetical protein